MCRVHCLCCAFPAHAGIDPSLFSSITAAASLPRARGDRPDPCGKRRLILQPSPRTRGSTRQVCVPQRQFRAFPAHAGIDPWLEGQTAVDWSLPPRTRGSTRSLRVSAARTGSFPAHAGIDPNRAPNGAAFSGLPRARGDRPYVKSSITSLFGPSLRTRGSTLFQKTCFMTLDRLPRARGDRLATPTWSTDASAPSPRTRGSTFPEVANRHQHGAFPAHAGIDPTNIDGMVPPASLPRARGDRPLVSAAGMRRTGPSPRTRGSTRPKRVCVLASAAFPAHAGIDLKLPQAVHDGQRLPRARGDRPGRPAAKSRGKPPSPRTRGSTCAGAQRGPAQDAFPAHAGIDLRVLLSDHANPSLPRARGDRP